MAIKRQRFERLDEQWVLEQLRRLNRGEGQPLGSAEDSIKEALCKVRWTVLWECWVDGFWVCADNDDEIVIVWDQNGPMCLWPDWAVVEEAEIPLSPVGEIRDVVRGIANPLDSTPVEIPLAPTGEIRDIEAKKPLGVLPLSKETLIEAITVLQRQLDDKAEQIQELQETLAWRDNLIEALQRRVDEAEERLRKRGEA